MKRLALASLLTVLVSAALAGPAGADLRYDPVCGKNAGNFAVATDLYYSSQTHTFSAWVNQQCGRSDHSFSSEIQYSTDAGNHWTDAIADAHVVDYEFGTSAANAGVQYNRQITFDAFCGVGRLYRERVWDFNGPDNSTLIYCSNPRTGGKN